MMRTDGFDEKTLSTERQNTGTNFTVTSCWRSFLVSAVKGKIDEVDWSLVWFIDDMWVTYQKNANLTRKKFSFLPQRVLELPWWCFCWPATLIKRSLMIYQNTHVHPPIPRLFVFLLGTLCLSSSIETSHYFLLRHFFHLRGTIWFP